MNQEVGVLFCKKKIYSKYLKKYFLGLVDIPLPIDDIDPADDFNIPSESAKDIRDTLKELFFQELAVDFQWNRN
jgi:hypothetical protein